MSQSGVLADHSAMINETVTSHLSDNQSAMSSSLLQDDPNDIGQASIMSCVLNLCNSIVGAALLGLPYAAEKVGWIASIILLAIFSILSAFTFQLQTSSGILYNSATNTLTSSYSNLCQATVPKLQLFADVTIFVNCFGSICAYLVIIGDLMPDAMALFIHKDDQFWNNLLLSRRFWIILFLSILIIPCSVLKKLDFLRFTSLFAMICFIFITISMIVFFNDKSVNLCDEEILMSSSCGLSEFLSFSTGSNVLNFFKATPVYTFAFGTHPLAFSLTNELFESSNYRMNIVILLSFMITTSYYIAIGILGYWTFGDSVKSNILNNYPQNSILLCCVRIGLSFALAFSYPVVITPGRQSFSGIIYKLNAELIPIKKWYFLTFIIILASFIIAMTVTDLGIVFGFIGSTSSPAVIFILPGFMFYYMDKLKYRDRDLTCWEKCNQYGSVISIIFGIILVLLSLFVFFLDYS